MKKPFVIPAEAFHERCTNEAAECDGSVKQFMVIGYRGVCGVSPLAYCTPTFCQAGCCPSSVANTLHRYSLFCSSDGTGLVDGYVFRLKTESKKSMVKI